jgi:hypothetical protein
MVVMENDSNWYTCKPRSWWIGYDDVLKGNEMENSSKKFWMITGDGNSPKVRHANRQDAVREAERLAKANPGIQFFVLEAVEMLTQPTGFVRQKL